MKRVLIAALVLLSVNSFAASNTDFSPVTPIVQSPAEEKVPTLEALVEEEAAISACVAEYIKSQSRSYTRVAKDNLYKLMNDFNSILTHIYGRVSEIDDVPYSTKIEMLARSQCEAYYKIGILK